MKIRDHNRMTWTRWFMNKPSFYRKMVWIALLSSIVPIMILGISSYAMTTKMIKQDASQDVSQILNYASQTIDTGMDRIQNNLIQMLMGSFFTSDFAEQKRNNYAGFIPMCIRIWQPLRMEILRSRIFPYIRWMRITSYRLHMAGTRLNLKTKSEQPINC